MKINLLKHPTEQDWLLVKKCAFTTIGKDTDVPPTEEWKRNMLKARHSPIRELTFVFELIDIPYWVSVHLCRHHIGCQPYVQTQRNDRQDEYDRNKAPQDAPVNMIWSMNAESLMNIANKRLCSKASFETRAVVDTMCFKVKQVCPEFADFLVPDCVYRGGCHEIKGCGLYGR